ncbi:hypothetical protein HYW41_03940 [Candidatus Daviesbacteria bacterium]|nr:hypothetical protein [Candidatus Daviesbacteria bacterium]
MDKRLKLIRQQIYGRETVLSKTGLTSQNHYQAAVEDKKNAKYMISNVEIGNFYQDLFKIGIFASLAIGSQVILFILMKNHVLNLNFF